MTIRYRLGRPERPGGRAGPKKDKIDTPAGARRYEGFGELDRVAMLLVTAYERIDVSICRCGPLHWGISERHGAFPYDGGFRRVTSRHSGQSGSVDVWIISRDLTHRSGFLRSCFCFLDSRRLPQRLVAFAG
jgi:hypothetical protein